MVVARLHSSRIEFSRRYLGETKVGTDDRGDFLIMERFKVVMVIIVSTGLILSFILLVTSVARPQLFHTEKDFGKDSGAEKYLSSCKNGTAIEDYFKLLSTLSLQDLQRIKDEIVKKIKCKTGKKCIEDNPKKMISKTLSKITLFKNDVNNNSHQNITVKVDEQTICVRWENVYKKSRNLGCQNRTNLKQKLFYGDGLVTIRFRN